MSEMFNRPTLIRILYFISISLNVLLDLVWLDRKNEGWMAKCRKSLVWDGNPPFFSSRMTYFMSFTIMVHLGFRTHDGIPLIKLPYFVQRFEARIQMKTLIWRRNVQICQAYAIQRAMGQNLHPDSETLAGNLVRFHRRLTKICSEITWNDTSYIKLLLFYAISFATAGKCWIIELTCPKVRIRFSINLFASISRWAYNGHFCVLLKWSLNQCRHFRWCLFNTKHDSSTHAQHVQEVSSSHFHPWFVAWGRFAAGHPFGEIASRNAPCQS